MLSPVLTSFKLLSKSEKIRLSVLWGGRILTNLLDLVGLASVGILATIVANGLTSGDSSFFGLEVPPISSRTFVALLLMVSVFFFSKSLLSAFLLRRTTSFLAVIEANYASTLTRIMFGEGIEGLRKHSHADLTWIAMNSSHLAFSTLLYSASALLSEGALFLLTFVAFLLVDPSAAFLIAGYFISVLGVFYLSISRRLNSAGESLKESNLQSVTSIVDLARCFREVAALDRREYFLDKFTIARREFAQKRALERFMEGLPRFFVESALMLGVLGLLLWQSLSGSIEEGIVTTSIFLAGGVRMMAALLPLQNAVTTIKIVGPQAMKAQEMIATSKQDRLESNQSPAAAVSEPVSPPNGRPPAIKFDNVSFHYRDSEEKVIQDVSFEVAGGTFLAVIGPSGAGKTTLVDLLLGILEPQDGNVLVDGTAPHRFRKNNPGKVSYVPQRPNLTSGSIADNVGLGIESAGIDRTRVIECLKIAKLWDFVSALPGGIDAEVGKQVDQLSGGQIQRLGLARALYSSPRLLVLDEATSALDATVEASLTQSIKNLGKSITLVVIAHRLSTVRDADEVIAMAGGRIVGRGTFEEVRQAVPRIEQDISLMRID